MPGPKMGPRPADFDEQVIRQSPTFAKWAALNAGEKLRYACREFVKGQGDDEERLMRRIMIARRNNLKDHTILKRAREVTSAMSGEIDNKKEEDKTNDKKSVKKKGTKKGKKQAAPPKEAGEGGGGEVKEEGKQASHGFVSSLPEEPEKPKRKRRPNTVFSDNEVAKEMDVPAVEATRSYRTWIDLPKGAEFCYNQKYIKGKEGHDWLLRKNIWRRMRYRRDNKKMVAQMRTTLGGGSLQAATTKKQPKTRADTKKVVSQVVDETPKAAGGKTDTTDTKQGQKIEGDATNNDDKNKADAANNDYQTGVEAAVAVAETYNDLVNNQAMNPSLDAAGVLNSGALDAAAALAAAATSIEEAAAAAEAAAASPKKDTAAAADTVQV